MQEQNVELEQERGITITSEDTAVEEAQELEQIEQELAEQRSLLEKDAELVANIRKSLEQAKIDGNTTLVANAEQLIYQLTSSRNMKFLINDRFRLGVKKFLRDKKFADNKRKQATQRLGSTKKFTFPPLSSLNQSRLVFDEGMKTKHFRIFEAAFYTVVESYPTDKAASAISRILFSCRHLKNEGFIESESGQVISNGIKDVVEFYSN